MNPSLSKIRIYPIKSLDPLELKAVRIGRRSLANDRAYAMLGEDGRFINGKRTGAVNQLKAEYDDPIEFVKFSKRGSGTTRTFNLKKEVPQIENYLSGFFGLKVSFIRNEEGRLLDVPDESSVTIVAKETIQTLAHELNEEEDTMRLRFRSNLEVSFVPPFWEDHLANPDSAEGVRFKIGDVELIGVSLRARCNVPPRNPFTGESDKSFIKRMMKSRANSIPDWSRVKEYGSLYHLTVNTFIPDNQLGKTLKLGDEVQIL